MLMLHLFLLGSKLNISADTTLPDAKRDIQYTINGVFQPEMTMAPGETQVWAIGNFHSMAYAFVRLRETYTGRYPICYVVIS